MGFDPFGQNDGLQFLRCLVQVLVPNEVVIGFDVGHFSSGSLETLLDFFRRLRTPSIKPGFEHVKRRRSHEHEDGLLQSLHDLLGPLGIDFQQHVHSPVHGLQQRPFGGPVLTAVHFRPLNERVIPHHGVKFLLFHEPVFDAVLFA